MLEENVSQFLNYCNNSDFSDRSLETLTFRLKEFNLFLSICPEQVTSVKQINYQHLAEFVADYNNPPVSVKKARVWTLHQFFHFLKLTQQIDNNIALQLPYPKIGKNVPQFLTVEEFNRILLHFTQQATDLIGMRNLVLISLLGFLGLRTATIVALEIQDIDLADSCIWIQEKGIKSQAKRKMPLPQVLCLLLQQYLKLIERKKGPLFLSKRKKRLARRSLQNLYRNSADKVGINKRLHPHLFRHTAATHLNQVAGTQITQFVLGHQRKYNTKQYAHLNPDIYATHMKNHPYMNMDL
jgi:site-specific recombinase XerD